MCPNKLSVDGNQLNGECMGTRHLGDPCSLQHDFYLLGSLLINPHSLCIILHITQFLLFAGVSHSRVMEVLSDDSTVQQCKDFVRIIFIALSKVQIEGGVRALAT